MSPTAPLVQKEAFHGSDCVIALLALVSGLLLVALAHAFSNPDHNAEPRNFDQLAKLAAQVPVPGGVSFVKANQAVNNGPGFITRKYEEVTRQFSTGESCQTLEDDWTDDLKSAHRKYRLNNEPHLYGGTGSLGIMVTDSPVQLGITLGTYHGAVADGQCKSPFVYAINNAH